MIPVNKSAEDQQVKVENNIEDTTHNLDDLTLRHEKNNSTIGKIMLIISINCSALSNRIGL